MTTAASTASFDPRSPVYLKDPHAALQDLLRDTPVFYSEPLASFCVLSYDLARKVIMDDDLFSNQVYRAVPVPHELHDRIPDEWQRAGQVVQGMQLHNLDKPVHTPQRRAVQKTFTPRRVNAAKPDIARIADELIDTFADRGSCDLVQEFATQLTLRAVVTMMNVPSELVPGFLAWIGDVFRILAPIEMTPEQVTTPHEELVSTYERVYKAFEAYSELLERRRADPGDDLASAMLTVTDEEGRPALSNDEVLAHMVGITAAGTDTTANLIVNLVRLFTEHPDQLQLVQNDPSLWENAVLEGLRRAAIVQQVFRIAKEDTEIGGVPVPAGAKIAIITPGANGDPAKFPDPLKFDVRRENAGEHLALGRGRHFCLGAPLVPPEARIAVERLYARLPGLTADLDQELEFLPVLAVRGMVSQRVTWTPA